MRRWPGRSLALWLCLTITAILGGALPLAATTTSQAALTEALAGGASLTVERQVAGPDAFAAFRQAVDDQVRATMGDRLVPQVAYGRLGPLELIAVNGRPWTTRPGDPLLEAMSFAPLVGGGQGSVSSQGTASGEAQLGMSRADAHRLGLHAGDGLCLAPRGGTAWCARLLELQSGQRLEGQAHSTRGTAGLRVPLADLFRIARLTSSGALVAGLTYRLDPVRAAEVPLRWLVERIGRLTAALRAAGGRVLSSPLATLARFEAEQQAANAWLRLLTALVVLEGIIASLGVANRLLDGWREQATVLRARGWTWRQVWGTELVVVGWILAGAVAAALLLDGALSRAAGVLPRLHPAGAPGLIAELSAPLVSLAVTLSAASALGALGVPAHPLSPESRPSPGRGTRLVTALLGPPGLAALIPSLVWGSRLTADPQGWLLPMAGVLLVGIALSYPRAPLRGGGHDPAAILARGQGRSRPTQHMVATLALMLATAAIVLATLAAAPDVSSRVAAHVMEVEAAGAGLGVAIVVWIGLTIHFRRIGDRRRREYAGLTGHGLTEDQIRRSLALERRWTWWCGLGGGSVLGLALEVSCLPRPVTSPWPVLGVAGMALCALTMSLAGGARLADRGLVGATPLTVDAIGDET